MPITLAKFKTRVHDLTAREPEHLVSNTGHPMAEGAATKRAGSGSFPKAKPTRLVVGGIGSGLTLGSPATVSP